MKTVPGSFMLENVRALMILALSESVAKLFIFAGASSSLFVSLYTSYSDICISRLECLYLV